MGSSNLIVRLFNVQTNENQVTEEEIKAIISEGTEHGAIEEAEQEIIERVFHLGDRNITSLMTHRSDIVWIDKGKSVAEIKLIMKEVVHSIYPVCDGEIDRIVGVISIKDFILSNDNSLVKNIMKPAMYVPENNTAYQY
jgi:putative hemolysin